VDVGVQKRVVAERQRAIAAPVARDGPQVARRWVEKRAPAGRAVDEPRSVRKPRKAIQRRIARDLVPLTAARRHEVEGDVESHRKVRALKRDHRVVGRPPQRRVPGGRKVRDFLDVRVVSRNGHEDGAVAVGSEQGDATSVMADIASNERRSDWPWPSAKRPDFPDRALLEAPRARRVINQRARVGCPPRIEVIGLVVGELQRRAACQQTNRDLTLSGHKRHEGDHLAVRRDRGRSLHANRIGEALKLEIARKPDGRRRLRIGFTSIDRIVNFQPCVRDIAKAALRVFL
jgi:hypothetical protein